MTQTDYVTNPFNTGNLTIHNIWGKTIGGFTFYKWILIGSAAIIALIFGLTLLCKLGNAKNQSEKTTNIEMKNTFQNNMPTYQHPELQIKMPTCPPTKTEHRGTNPVDSKPAPEVDEIQLEIERANLAKKRLLERINFSE